MHLLLITSEYPFGKGETFLENELPVLAGHFERLTIISLSEHEIQTRRLPDHVEVLRYPVRMIVFDKLLALRFLFVREVWEELKQVIFAYRLRLTIQIVATILISWARAKKIKSLLAQCIHDDHTIGYAYWTDDSALALAQLKREFPKMKGLSRFHGWDVYFEASSIAYLPFRKFINHQLDKQFAISTFGLEYVKERWYIKNPEKIAISRLGTVIEINQWAPRQKFNGQRLIVSCSNVIPLKRVELIFEVLNSLSNHSIRWVHFGDGQNLSFLKETIAIKKMKHLSVELPGRISNESVMEFYREEHPDFFINLSTTEGIPVSIMEAMSFGIPVLATDVGGTSEIVNDVSGRLIQVNCSNEEIIMSLNDILDTDLSEWNVKSEAAYLKWQTDFSAEKNYTDFIDQVLNGMI